MILPSTFMILDYSNNKCLVNNCLIFNYELYGFCLYLTQFIFINIGFVLADVWDDKIWDDLAIIYYLSVWLPPAYMMFGTIFGFFTFKTIYEIVAFTLYFNLFILYLTDEIRIFKACACASARARASSSANFKTSIDKKKKKNINPYNHQYGRYQYHNDFCTLLFPKKYYGNNKKNIILPTTNQSLYNNIKNIIENDGSEYRPFYLYETSGRIITICFSKIFVINNNWYVGYGATIWSKNNNNNLKTLLQHDLKKIRTRLDTPDSESNTNDDTGVNTKVDVGVNTSVDVNTNVDVGINNDVNFDKKWSKTSHFITARCRFKDNPIILRIDKEKLLNAMRVNGISRNINGPDHKGRVLIRSDVIGSYIRKFGVIFGCYAHP